MWLVCNKLDAGKPESHELTLTVVELKLCARTLWYEIRCLHISSQYLSQQGCAFQWPKAFAEFVVLGSLPTDRPEPELIMTTTALYHAQTQKPFRVIGCLM